VNMCSYIGEARFLARLFFVLTKSHPNLQIRITWHSGRMDLWGIEIDMAGLGYCHSGFWTFLDVFVSRLLHICSVLGLVSDHQFLWEFIRFLTL